MIPEIWNPDITIVFVGTAPTEPSNTIGFPHLHPKDRFWELLAMADITPQVIITAKERKALTEGHAQGSVADPVRTFFLQKKTSQLVRLGVGITDLNRRVVAESEKDKAARPTPDDVRDLIARAEELLPRILAFVTPPEVFSAAFGKLHPEISDSYGRQPFTIGSSEVWFLGSTVTAFRGEALEKQESAFFALGERVSTLRDGKQIRV